MAPAVDPPRPSEELASIILRCYATICSGEVDLLGDLFSEDPSTVIIGTDSEEWWEGKSTALSVMRAQAAEADGASYAAAVEPTCLRAWESGSMGWAVDQPIVVLPNGNRLETRCTVLFRLEGLQWRIVQWHFSLGQANEQAWGKRYTTSIDSIASSVEAERPDLPAAREGDGTVTLVFTDIEASTEMAERMGDERWMQLLHWHNELVKEQVARCNGTVVKSQGDGFMLAFSSASSALDCALATQQGAVAGFGEESVRIRIGVNAGDAIREQDDFFGHSVIVASRVAAQARGGETLVTELVVGLVAGADRFSFGSPREAQLKGISGSYVLRPLLQPA